MSEAINVDTVNKVNMATKDELDALFEELCRQCETADKLSEKLCSKLEKLSETERKKLVSRKKDNKFTLLFLSAKRGILDIVSYLLVKCKADVNQAVCCKGEREQLNVTALMKAENVDVARCLLKHGAKGTSEALLMHVMAENFEVADYLRSRGALINVIRGVMVKVWLYEPEDNDTKLFELLIKYGANVNGQDQFLQTPLHFAVHHHQLWTVAQLLKYGADPTIKDRHGYDVLQLSCRLGNEAIFEYLLKHVEYSANTKANAHELMGITYIPELPIDEGPPYHPMIFKHWRTALRIRLNGGDFLERDPIDAPPFCNMKEFRAETELDGLASNFQSILLQAVFITRRILGASHPVTFRLASNPILLFADNNQFKECIQLIMYTADGYNVNNDIQPDNTLEVMTSLINLFLSIAEKVGIDHECIQFKDVTYMIAILTAQFEHHKVHKFTLYLLTTMLDLLFRLPKNKSQKKMSINLIKDVAKKKFRDFEGHSALHISVSKTLPKFLQGLVDGFYKYQYPRVPFVQLLLECGHDIDALDYSGSTPLHLAVCIDYDVDVVNCLLDHGAHIDVTNDDGIRPCFLLDLDDRFDTFKCVTLKCLAARTIVNKKIPYHDINFPALATFIEMH